MNNRSRAFTDEKDALCNKDNKYDIVIGPVADDNMALLFRQYEHEIIDFDTLLRGMIQENVFTILIPYRKKHYAFTKGG